MSEFWSRVLLLPAGLAVLALVLWALIGATFALLVFSLALMILLGLYLRQMSALDRWLADSEASPVPEGRGIWEDTFAALNQVVKHHRKTEAQLTSALGHLEQATAALPEGVVILDETDRIEWCNPLGGQHFGLDARRDLGQQITYLARQPEFVQYLSQRRFAEPLILRGSRQDELTLSVKLIPYGDNKRLMISRDITQFERLETMRRDFVANVSHELRTPLTVVNGFVETLLDMKDRNNEMTQRGLQLMGEQTERMTHLVDDLLTLSKLESDSSLMQEEAVDVLKLIQSVHEEGQELSAGQHQVSVELESRVGLTGNLGELRSAFSNLVTNAIRYTPAGGSIVLSWAEVGGDPVFSVRDSGIGIAPQHIPRLTERFYRVDRSRSRETGGTGLGLAIVKHIANRHQAQLEVVSAEGKGSTFSLVFPEQRRV
ncbi:MAG: phosphate regulon sensor histidine kinase PhoR [Nitrosomonadales bacterium]|nr:phosphate regulon sensor histidine kinase PhoR [Nitrosomonadales bacterium]